MNKLIDQILEKHFKQDVEGAESVFNQLAFYIYSLDSDQNDLHILAKILPDEQLQKLITYYDGKHMKVPTQERYQECLLVSLCFYLKEIKGWNWAEIKSFMDLPDKYKKEISMISLGGKINKVKERLTTDLRSIIETLPIQEFHKVFTQTLQNKLCDSKGEDYVEDTIEEEENND